METQIRGYKVRRHTGRYIVSCYDSSTHPRVFGLEVLSEIPTREGFQEWVTGERERLDRKLKEWEEQGCPANDNYPYFITTRRPMNTFGIEWIYEIDFDRLLFHINSQPLFRLDNMPPQDIFLTCISYDHYGYLTCATDAPEEHRYNWKPAPPPIDDKLIDVYQACTRGLTASPIHDLLVVREDLSRLESVWVRLLEVEVGQLIRRYDLQFREVESRASRAELTEMDLALGLSIVHLAFSPSPLRQEGSPSLQLPKSELWWVRENVCVSVMTHLDDERNFCATVAALHKSVMRTADAPNIVYGVVTSVFHLAVVRIEKSAGTAQCTPPFQLLPSFHATSASTPGITALARLGRFTTTIARLPLPPLSLDSPLSLCPIEILSEIASYLPTLEDLKNFSVVSDATFAAAEPFLKFPQLATVLLHSPRSPTHRGVWLGRCHPHLVEGHFYGSGEDISQLYSVCVELSLQCVQPVELRFFANVYSV